MALAAVLGLVWEVPIALRMIGERDFPFHLETAEVFASTGQITVPHFLMQVLLGSLYATGLFATIQQAGLLFMYVVHAATAALVCWYIARSAPGHGSLVGSAWLAVALLMCAPLLPPAAEATVYLIGYFPANAYHSPTTLVAKPFLVLSFAAAVAAVTRTTRPTRAELVWMGLPVALVGITKPNYLACLVPVVAIGSAWQWLRGRPFAWTRVLVLCGSAILSLGVTYLLFVRIDPGYETGIVFAPFEVIALYSPSDAPTLVAKLLASIALPLAAVLLWPRAAWGDAAMRMAWAAAAIGVAISYLFAEVGLRFGDGNFLWTGQMAVFVLFVATGRFVMMRFVASSPASRLVRGLVLLTVLALHVASGLRHVRLAVGFENWWRWLG